MQVFFSKEDPLKIEVLFYLDYICFRNQYLKICKSLKKEHRKFFIGRLLKLKSKFDFNTVSEIVKISVNEEFSIKFSDETVFNFFLGLPFVKELEFFKAMEDEDESVRNIFIKILFLLKNDFMFYTKLRNSNYDMMAGPVLFLLHKIKTRGLFLKQFCSMSESFLEGLGQFLETQ